MTFGKNNRKTFLVQGFRTPFGKFGGSLGSLKPVDLGVFCTKEILKIFNKNHPLNPQDIADCIVGNVLPSTADTLYAGRHIALKSSLSSHNPGITINRLCGSGLQAIIDATKGIQLGEGEAYLAGGVENMTLTPHLVYGSRFGTKYGALTTQDLLLQALTDEYAHMPMAQTAEKLAEIYSISREECDQYALNSHLRANKAYEEGLLQGEIVSLTLPKKNLDRDEHLRAQISIEDLQSLKPAFPGGKTVTPGTASGVVDGACMTLIANEDFCRRYQLQPLAEIEAYSLVGVDPTIMGIGPVNASIKLMTKMNLNAKDIDLWEINEAFAPQILACQKELNISNDQLNIWGGAISLGHPLGASGARITLSLARQLQHYKKKRGIASACIGGGQGISILLKNVN
jgi:acetyl-CoA acyltransferase 2